MEDASGEAPDAASASASVAPLKQLRVDLVRLRYAPVVRDARGGTSTRDVIHPLSTTFLPGTLTGLMGPSGSGKTSLLTVLAGFADEAHVHGAMLVNGERAPPPKKLVGLCFQDDLMLPALTVFETLKFAADLRMSRACTDAQRAAACETLLAKLNLGHVASRLVGGAARRGVSGGERKRLAVAVELVTRPALLLMDEPTSGLDAAAALALVTLLRELAANGQTVVCAIHQPRTAVFDAFDHLVLLSNGRVLYDGQPSSCAAALERAGAAHPLPPRTNPADWIVDVIVADEALGEEGRRLPSGWAKEANAEGGGGSLAAECDDLVLLDAEAGDVEAGSTKRPAGSMHRVASAESLRRVGLEERGATFWRQLSVLTRREHIARRGQNLTRINAAQMLAMAVLTSLFWWRMPDDTDAHVMERFSILFFVIIAQSNAVVFACVATFAKERALMLREHAKGMYNPLPFFLAKTAAESVNTLALPCAYAGVIYFAVGLRATPRAFFVFLAAFALCILVAQSLGLALSCAIPDASVASLVAPMLILMLMILGGFYVNFSSMPPFIRWLSWASQARYGFNAMVVNEFEGRTFACAAGNHARYGASCPLAGEEVIDALEMRLTVSECLLALVAMQVVLRVGAYVAMLVNFTRKGSVGG